MHARHLFNVSDTAVSHQNAQHQLFGLWPAAYLLVDVLELLAAPMAQKILPARVLYAIFDYLHTVAVRAVYVDSYLALNFL
ncbi:hypothetical protein ACMA1I_02990 [Pontibacter sp. 13R65]|uniref:hypothetical protein n=1 Tax=Pontibacter sp. 13R65 TaxID=3127458 RepID=UPI00301C2A2E